MSGLGGLRGTVSARRCPRAPFHLRDGVPALRCSVGEAVPVRQYSRHPAARRHPAKFLRTFGFARDPSNGACDAWICFSLTASSFCSVQLSQFLLDTLKPFGTKRFQHFNRLNVRFAMTHTRAPDQAARGGHRWFAGAVGNDGKSQPDLVVDLVEGPNCSAEFGDPVDSGLHDTHSTTHRQSAVCVLRFLVLTKNLFVGLQFLLQFPVDAF